MGISYYESRSGCLIQYNDNSISRTEALAASPSGLNFMGMWSGGGGQNGVGFVAGSDGCAHSEAPCPCYVPVVLTSIPSPMPSPIPSPMPSSNPSPMPSPNPSPMPSSSPSPMPSQNPSPMPSSNPSPMPSSNPTWMPTSKPTLMPTSNPVDRDLELVVTLLPLWICLGLCVLGVCLYKLMSRRSKVSKAVMMIEATPGGYESRVEGETVTSLAGGNCGGESAPSALSPQDNEGTTANYEAVTVRIERHGPLI